MDMIKDTVKIYPYDPLWHGTDMIKFYITPCSIIECIPNFLSLNNLEIWI